MTDPEPPTPACPICHRADPNGQSWATCTRCVTRVDRQLADLLDLHALAGHALEPTASTGAIGGVPGSRPPLDVAALDVALGEQALGVLESWERWWREHWGLAPYGDASASRLIVAHSHGNPELASTPTSRNLSGCVAFLRAWWPRASETTEPPPDEFADEVRKLHRQTVAALRLHEPQPWSVSCPTDGCGYRLRIEHDGRDAILRCPRCTATRTLANLLYVAMSAGRPIWLDAEAAAHALHVDVAHLGPLVRDGRLRSRGARDCRQYDINSARHAADAG